MSLPGDDTCIVCGLTRPVEMHHPIPRRAGGEEMGTVPLCEECHTAIDRVPIDRWNPLDALGAMSKAWAALDTDGRRMLLKMVALTSDAHRMLTIGCAAAHIKTRAKRGKAPGPVEPANCASCAATVAEVRERSALPDPSLAPRSASDLHETAPPVLR